MGTMWIPCLLNWNVTAAEANGNLLKAETLDCNYDENCTPLYSRIEKEDWDAVTSFLETGLWPFQFVRDELTPSVQVRTWVHRERPDLPAVWRQLPLHLAVMLRAPVKVVQKLVALFPESVRLPNDEQMLPLHLALYHSAHEEVVGILLTFYPTSILLKGKKNYSSLEFAMNTDRKTRIRILTAYIEQQLKGKEVLQAEMLCKASDQDLESSILSFIYLEHEKDFVETTLKQKLERLSDVKQQIEEKDQELKEVKNWMKFSNSRNKEGAAEASLYQNLTSEKKETEQLKEQLIREIESLRLDLQSFVEYVSCSKNGLSVFVKDVTILKNSRSRLAKKRIIAELDLLKQKLKLSLTNKDESSVEKITAMTMVLNGLETTNLSEETDENLTELNDTLNPLKEELWHADALKRIRCQIELLWRILSKELVNADDMKAEDLTKLTTMIASIQHSMIDSTTVEELLAVKAKARSMKNYILFKITQTTGDASLGKFEFKIKKPWRGKELQN